MDALMEARAHFISQFHLKNFRASKEEVQKFLGREFRKRAHVWCWERPTGRCLLKPVKDVACLVDFYAQARDGVDSPTDSDFTDLSLEAAFAKVESLVSPHMEMFRHFDEEIDQNGLAYIREFMMFQFLRTPARLNAVSSGVARAMESALRANEQKGHFVPELVPMTMYTRDPATAGNERHRYVGEHLALHKRSCWGVVFESGVRSLEPFFERASFEVLWAPEGASFVIGDDPVTIFNPYARSWMMDAVGYKGTEVAMPLSPRVSVRGCILHSTGRTRVRRALPDEVDSLNARQFARAVEHVYSHSRIRTPSLEREVLYRPMEK